MNNYQKSYEYLKERIISKTKTAIVIGSGLSGIIEKVEDKNIIPYGEIPEFLHSTAPTHRGELISGYLYGKPVVCLNGRFHYYEGYQMQQVAEYIKVLKLLGIEHIILTNASGSMYQEIVPGDLVVVEDHINFSGLNPLRGKNDESFGPRFVDMSNAYSKRLIEKVFENSSNGLKKGTYVYGTGPSFETAAEIRAFKTLGGTIVGMSTVPEVIMCAYCGIEVLTISCVSNYAPGIPGSNVSDEELVRVTGLAQDKFSKVLEELFNKI
ncbi:MULTISPECIES: purine-nucleoside phosphorylase [Bacillus cereus group]|uniref:Purine nucleoside phosphorylase n=1 Tax=Bacillus thuringiensis serovar mexicanensis TaxID=180868 RepID=A0A242VY11_BACTU|nr:MULTISPECIES: purine-nucleoside phosphorylase [Bacillus cereus group]EEM56473.1 Purine nucleoside phosphorylase I, inosine and guanosine-specific [Bacillus thuringiensis serovar monterrey BGSC 4AJ1]MEB9673665.1 purine-nucleoside phosphorylase [Bacillus anthracis]OTW43679.1 purine-nucleoside phosphorylase [Bacillus thuringiensis serovar mexicanensis]OTW95681.1 purine-nucleoside phosphorylase [Bacillus thuringiensis serovar monterrey]